MDKYDDASVAQRSCEVLIIGGGPAGTTAGFFLKNKDRDVVLVDKDDHPRFHIGESLLPMNLPLFEKLGVLEQVKEMGVRKDGAEFVTERNESHTFYFRNAFDKTAPPYAYQVRRSEFDKMLLDNAEKSGVRVFRKHRVTDVKEGDSSVLVTVKDPEGKTVIWDAGFVIDASGRNTFLGRKFRLRKHSKKHNSAAIFGHFTGVQRRTGDDEGNISIYWFEHGWFWMIPLTNGIMSVGAVCHPDYLMRKKESLDSFFYKTVKLAPGVENRMQEAKQVGKINVTGNFTYSAARSYGNRYLMVGDSFAFLDPVFSSGVFLAMSSAELAADAVDKFLSNPEQREKLFTAYERKVRKGMKTVSWFIFRFNSVAMRSLFMSPRNVFRIEEAVISMLAGDIYGQTPIRSRLLIFRIVYYLSSLKRFPVTLTEYFRRKRNVRIRFSGGTLDVD